MGACIPDEIWRQIPGTRPDKGAILLKSKNATKLDDCHVQSPLYVFALYPHLQIPTERFFKALKRCM